MKKRDLQKEFNRVAARLDQAAQHVSAPAIDPLAFERMMKLFEQQAAFDATTQLHAIRVAYYGRHLAAAAGYSPEECTLLQEALFLHDIGKTDIDKELLNYAGRYDKDQMDKIKFHTIDGAETLLNETGDDPLGILSAELALYHHEQITGGGYFGKKAKDLPRHVRLSIIVDVYEALTGDRPYRKANSPKEALAIMDKMQGPDPANPQFFDPDLFATFKSMAEKLRASAPTAADDKLKTPPSWSKLQ